MADIQKETKLELGVLFHRQMLLFPVNFSVVSVLSLANETNSHAIGAIKCNSIQTDTLVH